ncbi:MULTISPECIES: SDR family NAD(P)-dependent oxidoreductase [unclassified Arsukibacterium]|uniref:SDR family NAD(P)-dependent oxidoreductase n=1 Tax=unclassified Arsukibacterium TaxID=2635278 RepID=UPI000C683B55|nr:MULTISPECIES: SDR family oxidoreductase [unclassified Arsukibacterium]MBM34524.1 hypothetical protein [Rheinheimera sp.]HAW91945.1 hypothetical protein [Candidatus Azambacteria bacterium]|tara:strand:+ start:39671 stop:40447 length:777 start_codon:yes stop_codon:yes gene_type:complete
MLNNLLVTGATSALACSLIESISLKKGYKVLAVSRGKRKLPELDGFKDFQYISGIDLTDKSDLLKLERHVSEFFNDGFNVVHFAGDFWRHKPLVCTDFEEITSMINSHFVSLCGVAKAVTPSMMKFKSGRLVAFSCNSVGFNYPDMSPFTSSKAAVEAFIKCYANEKAPYGISATAIALPTMKTAEILEEKPGGDHQNYIEPSELSKFILENVLAQPRIATGNIVRLINHSPTFYGQGYFERNPRNEMHNKTLQQASS